MKVTKSYLKQIIKEEISKINEGAWDAEVDREKNLKFILWTASQRGLSPQTKIKDIPGVEWILQYHSKENDPATIYPLNSESSISNAKEVVNKEFPDYPWAK